MTTSNARVLATGAFVMTGALVFGVDAGGLSGFLAMPKFNQDFGTYDPLLDAVAVSANLQLLWGMVPLGLCIFACLISGEIGTRFGRRTGLSLLGLSGIVGAVLQLTATTAMHITAGKAFLGLTFGFASSFVPLYLAEIAPANLRGILVTLYQTGINTGQLIGAGLNLGTYALTTRWAYRGPFAAEIVFPAILLLGVWLIPETPRWLMLKGRHEQAASSIRRLRGPNYPQEAIDADLKLISDSLEEERQISGQGSYAELFQGTNRRRTLLSMGIMFAQQYSGISFLTSYGTYFFSVSGVTNAFLVGTILQVLAIAGILVAAVALKYVGRRPIMIYGGVAQAICMLLFAIIGVAKPNSPVAAKTLAAFTLLYNFFVNISWAPVAWVIASELGSTRLRSKTFSLAAAVNWSCTISLAGWLPFALSPSGANLGSKLGFIFGPFIVLATVWMYFYLPETGNRSLEELDQLFHKGVPAREFATYILSSDVHEDVHEKSGSLGA